MNDVHYSSASHEWATPQDFFDKLDEEFAFTLDPCATSENAKCSKFYTLSNDGLSHDWAGERVFMNPPYGRGIGKWVRKAAESRALVVALIPARTDTSYWHDYIFNNPQAEVRFLRGRIYFKQAGKTDHAPFPSAVIVFRGGGDVAQD